MTREDIEKQYDWFNDVQKFTTRKDFCVLFALYIANLINMKKAIEGTND